MANLNRTCVICGTQYKACKNCEEARKFGGHRWRMSCDRVECFQVLLVLTDFYYHKITKQEAREMLSGLLLEVPPPYVPEAQVILDSILFDDATENEQAEDLIEEEPDIESAEAYTEQECLQNPEVEEEVLPTPALPAEEITDDECDAVEPIEDIVLEEESEPEESLEENM